MIAPAIGAKPRNFTFVVSLLAAALIIFGFSFSVGPDLLFRLRPAVLYLHALTAVTWVVLVVVQAGLVRKRNLALHRKIGVYGLWLGAVVSATSFLTALILRHDSVIRHGNDGRVDARIAFLSIPLAGFVVFTATLALAAYWRNRPALHRRCIMLSWTGLMGAALARMPFLDGVKHAETVLTIGLVIALCGQDWWTARRLHPLYLISLPLILAVQQGADYLFSSHPAWWVATARAMIGV
jgi:hypothetical protein